MTDKKLIRQRITEVYRSISNEKDVSTQIEILISSLPYNIKQKLENKEEYIKLKNIRDKMCSVETIKDKDGKDVFIIKLSSKDIIENEIYIPIDPNIENIINIAQTDFSLGVIPIISELIEKESFYDILFKWTNQIAIIIILILEIYNLFK